jgi:exodeoxyribonuclease V beta subunit
MTAGALPEFSIRDPLPSGLTVLEASAGTGKTYSLAGLVTRYLAEGLVEASQVCVVSFTVPATAELRGRIREKLAEAARHLDSGEPSTDDVIALLLEDESQRAVRRQRVLTALAEFDAATISTIHGFCSRVVATAGTGVDVTFTSDDSDVDEVVNDRFLDRFGTDGDWPAEPKKVAEAVRLRLRIPDAELFVPDRSLMSRADSFERADVIDRIIVLVDDIVAEVRRRRAVLRRRTFDSLLVEARDLLDGPRRDVTRAVLQQRFRLVMIDEFQDTDRVQWDIFRSAFLEGPNPATVVVVGDPKQSIYRFRSAELSAYLAARALAGQQVTSLGTNRRSDASLIDALERLFSGFTFGHPEVAFQRVQAASTGAEPALVDPGPGAAPLQLRLLDAAHKTPEANADARHDLVGEIVRMLGEVTIADPKAPGGRRRLAPSDIGVLVRSNADATAIVAMLSASGVPAASSSNDSVLDSEAATQWRVLLSALERPSSAPRARAAALSWFVGMTPPELDALDHDGLDGLSGLVEQLRAWALCLATGGLAALMAEVRAQGLLERVLADTGGERALTDLDHVLELMQSAVGGRPTAAAALLAVLDGLVDPELSGDEDAIAPELLSRRIDRDDDTVKVLTVHRAKGLEFPVVLCPTLWRKRANIQGLPHAQVDGLSARLIDTNAMIRKKTTVGAFLEVSEVDRDERFGEDRRLLYVALTRAKHRLVLWWSPAGCNKTTLSPLGELVDHAARSLDPSGLESTSEGAIAVVSVAVPPQRPLLTTHAADDDDLSVRAAERVIDRTWYRWSFSSIKARMEHLAEEASAAAALDAPTVGGVDEPSEVVPPLDAVLSVTAAPMPLQSAPAGTAFGTLVHSVMERVDFAAPDVAGQLRERCAELLHYRALAVTPDTLAAGLLHAIGAPLGGCMGDRRLLDLERFDRLDELGFDLPLAGLDARAVAEVVADHLPADDALRPWFVEAASRGLAVDVAGLLTGSIDLVARTTDGRYWLADYKTNLISDGDYRHPSLAEAMAHHGYPLQATLYLVALHRYLRWRKGAAYDPDTHLDGAAYLFLRGMDPAASPTAEGGPGIVWWRPPTAAIEELDRLLARGVVA